jgi:hypothetical protein
LSVLIEYFVVSIEDKPSKNRAKKEMRRMQWYNYLGWMLVGIFILFFGIGMFAGINENQAIIPILVVLSRAAGLILVNKY